MTTKPVDLSSILAGGPRNCWVALNEDQSKIVGRGESMREAVDEAQKNGVNEPVIIWSPKQWIPAIYRG